VDVGGVDLFEDYPRGKFVGIERRINGDVLCREGLARVLVWAALFRNWTVRDWLALAELAWKPLRTGKFNKETVSHEDVTALQSILERLTTRGWAAIPKSVDLDIHFPKGTSDTGQGNHQLLCEYLGQGMSKAVIGGTLTVEAGNRGARSLGEVQERVKRELRDADALSEMPSVQRYLVEPFYRLNYGESLRPSTFVFQTEDALDTLKLAQTIKTLVEAGDPSIPIAWGHDQAGIPVAADDEPVFGAYSIPDEDSEDADDAQGKAAGRDTDHD
jgi:phage gp29-like protein